MIIKSSHPQTQRDKAKIQERKHSVGRSFEPMKKALACYVKDALQMEAALFREAQDKEGTAIPELDRIDLRSRESLICWFCVYHPEALHGEFIADLTPFVKRRGPRPSGRRRSVSKNEDKLQDAPNQDIIHDRQSANKTHGEDSEWYDFPPDDTKNTSDF
jgi:hypothetical protein